MITDPQIVDSPETATAAIRLLIPANEIAKHMDEAILELVEAILDQGVDFAGPMVSLHFRRPTTTFDCEIAFPIADPIEEVGRVMNSHLPSVKVVRTVYQGPYEGLVSAWGELQAWMAANDVAGTEMFMERYLTNPDVVEDPNLYQTELNWVITK
jgi:effector-binding domain-containing protein